MALEYFCCFHSYLEKTRRLSDQELGRLFRALMQYSAEGTEPDLAGRELIAFEFIAPDIDASKVKYAEKCRKNFENVQARYERIRSNTNEYEDLPWATNGTNPKQKPKQKQKQKDIERMVKSSDDSFEKFWEAYPKKVAKQEAKKAFDKANVGVDVLLADIQKRTGTHAWREKQYIPNPSTYLNQRRWEDEIDEGKAIQPKTFPTIADVSTDETDRLIRLTEKMRAEA